LADYFSDYTAVLIATVAGTVLVLISFAMSSIVAPKARSVLKDVPYECGVEPIGEVKSQIHFRYYLFAILFLIFDVEAVFLFPWAVILLGPGIGEAIFYEMLVFLGILTFGLLYSWKKGVLEWK
jgi:NADH:ubiquinone oxidoreductase subunit 3 (subunit A)